MTIVELTSELFLFLVVFRRKVTENVAMSVDSVANDLEMVFARMDKKAAEDAALSPKYAAQRKILVIIADGIIAGSDWDKALDYRSARLLEHKFYQSNVGGDLFYEEVNKVAEGDSEAREIFFTALSLGFQGRLARQPDLRKELRRKLYNSLSRRIVNANEKITPRSYEHLDERDCTIPPARRLSTYAILLVGIFTFVFFLGKYIYSQQISEIQNAAVKLAELSAPVQQSR
jgi:type IV/VI secretion system ImpK/VasF family protein